MKTTELIRVVLVDDHAVLRQGLRRLLEDEPDIEVVGEAANGLEAIAVTRALAPDLVLMDVVMPRLNGLEATKQIKQSNPATAVLVLSAHDDDRYVLGLLEAGAAGYLLKSATAQEVIHAIRAVHAGEAVLHPAIAGRLLSRAARPPTRVTLVHGNELLTEREVEVLRCAAKGLSNKEIASQLVLSVPTVKAHLVNIFNKMGVGSRTEAVMQALNQGWMELDAIAGEAAAGIREVRPRNYPRGA
jgi:two-component system, NarL family, response regulator LiaR